MLKIKDNVDLKELERFGFEYEPILHQYFKIKIDLLGNVHLCRIDETTKEILSNNPALFQIVSPNKNKIYKRLCRLNLIEKVE